ncbi:MAG: hypothetical protein PHS93_05585 [Candidatus Omnitrophica bacterium]|nr:hypothetical protein [Candidatus Omnitrophota bacterium]MDD5352622.1 hypothetical protein [Candidatus Omnitrophota bacterium]MDD5550221.1 hypothetical protein [Candidatus Omnitrophota bacterium]
MMRQKANLLAAFVLVAVLFSILYSFAEEKITLTTYYPAPYGIYKELRVDQMAVGSYYRSATLTNGTLLVSDNVGIGTSAPVTRLTVNDARSYTSIATGAAIIGYSNVTDTIGSAAYPFEIQNLAVSGGNNNLRLLIYLYRRKSKYSTWPWTGTAYRLQYDVDGTTVSPTNGRAFLELGEGDPAVSGADSPYVSLGTNSLERLVINAAGNVGIGTTSPTLANLQLQTSANNGNFSIYAVMASNDYWKIYSEGNTNPGNNGVLIIETGDDLSEPIIFRQRSASSVRDAMAIDAAGNVGIGTSAPTQALDTIGRITIHPSGTNADNAYNGNLVITKPQASGQYINIIRQGAYPWSIGTVYNSSTFAIGAGTGTDSSFTSPYFVIKPGGYVGIGTTNPTARLDVRGSSNTCVRITYTDSSGTQECPADYYLAAGSVGEAGIYDDDCYCGGGAETISPPIDGTRYFICCRACNDQNKDGVCD